MELRRTHHGHPRLRSLVVAGAAGVVALSVVGSAPNSGCNQRDDGARRRDHDDRGRFDHDGGRRSDDRRAGHDSSGGTDNRRRGHDDRAATASSSEFAAALEAECEGDTGNQLLASGLQVVIGADGSLRIVEIVLACDIEFIGAVDEALGRPTTNVEALIADPANNVTPSQDQTDLLNEELATYWRIADAWAQSQGGAAPDEDATDDRRGGGGDHGARLHRRRRSRRQPPARCAPRRPTRRVLPPRTRQICRVRRPRIAAAVL